MEVKYTFTPKEKLCIKALKSYKNSYNYSMKFDEFQREFEEELASFKNEGLIERERGFEGSWITFNVSKRGLEAFSKK